MEALRADLAAARADAAAAAAARGDLCQVAAQLKDNVTAAAAAAVAAAAAAPASGPQDGPRVVELETALAAARSKIKQLTLTVLDLKGAIRVACRVRPSGRGESAISVAPDATAITLRAPPATGRAPPPPATFPFTTVFPPAASQADVYTEVTDLVASALDGYGVSILCYGQTGSGKTHTMFGGGGGDTDPSAGITPRAVAALLASVREREVAGWRYTLSASCVEIHQRDAARFVGPHRRPRRPRPHRADRNSTLPRWPHHARGGGDAHARGQRGGCRRAGRARGERAHNWRDRRKFILLKVSCSIHVACGRGE